MFVAERGISWLPRLFRRDDRPTGTV